MFFVRHGVQSAQQQYKAKHYLGVAFDWDMGCSCAEALAEPKELARMSLMCDGISLLKLRGSFGGMDRADLDDFERLSLTSSSSSSSCESMLLSPQKHPQHA